MIYSKLINHTTHKGSQIYLNDHKAVIKVHQKHGKHGDCPPAFKGLKSDDILLLHQKANRPNVLTHIVRVINGNELIEDPLSEPYTFIRNCEVLYYLDPCKVAAIKVSDDSYIFNTAMKSVNMQDLYGWSTHFYVGNGNCKEYPYAYDVLINKISKHPSYSSSR